jgi:iron complex outermembrane receptor protein
VKTADCSQSRAFGRAIVLCGVLALPMSVSAAQQPGAKLDTVTVVASRTRVSDALRAVEVITREDIARSTANNVAGLLAERMGVDVYSRSAAQADISLRGSTAEQTLVLVDGVRVSDVQSSHYALDLAVPLNSIERVEILRGAGSAMYGPDGIGGVINIVTRRDARGADAAVRGGAFGTIGGNATAGNSVGAMQLRTSAEYEKSDGYRAGTDYRIGQARVALSAPAGAGTLSANLGVGIRDFGANDFYGPYNSTERTGSVTADAAWQTSLDQWTLSATGATRRHTDRFTLIRDNPQIYENLHQTWQSTGELVARTTLSAATVAFGTDILNAQLSSNNLGSRQEWRSAGFGEATFGSAAGSLLDVGVRGDQSSIYGGFFSPSVAFTVPVNDDVRFRASAGRGFRAPTWTERYYSDPTSHGNPDLVPETFWTGEVGLRVAPTGFASLDISGYVRHADNLIDWVRPAGAPTAIWQATNVGSAMYRGVEATVGLPEWRGIEWSFTGTGLLFDDEQGAGLSGKYALRPVTQQYGTRARVALSSSVHASLEMMQARRAGEDGYYTGNIRFEWQRKRVSATFDITNISNAEWLDASGEPTVGRAVYVGFKLN